MSDEYRGSLLVGDVVTIQGYLFRVESIVCVTTCQLGYLVCQFVGTVTGDARNDSIRNTGYARGCYSVALRASRTPPTL